MASAERPARVRRRWTWAGPPALLVLAGCAPDAPSTLDPHGPAAERIATLWWIMFGISAAVVLAVTALLLVGVARRRRAAADPDTEPRWALGMVLGGGVVFPVLVLALLWVLTLREMAALSEPAGASTLTIDVRGHRWWWEVVYPEQGVVTANEVRIPAGEPVTIRLTTQDILHSFWVPQLTGKIDMVTGRTNTLTLEADRPGVYRGQCAEFCGVQHALMIFFVRAEPRADFDAWLSARAQAPAAPTEPQLARGLEVFLEQPCAACHRIAGTGADGTLGPDLTDFGGRLTLGAGAAPNDRGHLGGWIVNSQTIKPGNLMPPIELGGEDLQALIAFLESLG